MKEGEEVVVPSGEGCHCKGNGRELSSAGQKRTILPSYAPTSSTVVVVFVAAAVVVVL